MTSQRTIYLDNAGTSFPKPDVVYAEMERFLRTLGANPGRGGHRMAVEAEAAIDRTRHTLSRFFHIPNHNRIVFTLNCTDALNIGMKGLLRNGDHVITSVLEHNSVSRPLQHLAEDGTIELTRIDCSDDGYLDPGEVKKALRPHTKLVVITHASNVLGTVQPIRDVGAIAREAQAIFMVDAAQTAGVLPIDVREDYIDLLAFPGHKALLGPPGSGGLYVADGLTLRPWREGGTGGDSASPLQPPEFPYFLEGGTPNTVGIVGLGAGVAFIMKEGLDHIQAHERTLRRQLLDAFRENERISVYGPLEERPAVSPLSARLKGIDPEEAGGILDQSFGVAVRCGLHCAPYVHRRMGTHDGGTIRFSAGYFNTAADIETAAHALQEISESVSSF